MVNGILNPPPPTPTPRFLMKNRAPPAKINKKTPANMCKRAWMMDDHSERPPEQRQINIESGEREKTHICDDSRFLEMLFRFLLPSLGKKCSRARPLLPCAERLLRGHVSVSHVTWSHLVFIRRVIGVRRIFNKCAHAALVF